MVDLSFKKRGYGPDTSVEQIHEAVSGFCVLHLFPQMLDEKYLNIHSV